MRQAPPDTATRGGGLGPFGMARQPRAEPRPVNISPPSRRELEELFRLKYGEPADTGWGPRLRWAHGYFNPDDHYEALLLRLVEETTRWLDVGCGRHLLSPTGVVARTLADRCELLVGVDPDETLSENPYVHEKVQSPLLDYRTDRQFDLITLRMVAEHLADPAATVRKLWELSRPGGLAVVYTVHKWSPLGVAARVVPHPMHQPLKRFFWGTAARDTFPVIYRMNTRRELRSLFEREGFEEALLCFLDDCRTTGRFRLGQQIELALLRLLRAAGLRYPEVCLLGVWKKSGPGSVSPTLPSASGRSHPAWVRRSG